MSKTKGKTKGQLRILQVGMGTLFGIGVTLMFLLLFLAQAEDTAKEITGNNTSVAVVAVQATSDAFAQIPTWLPLIVLVLIFAALWGFIRLMQSGSGGFTAE